jgi:hypothetical protein
MGMPDCRKRKNMATNNPSVSSEAMLKAKKWSHDDEAPSNTEELPFSRKEQMRGSLLPTQW